MIATVATTKSKSNAGCKSLHGNQQPVETRERSREIARLREGVQQELLCASEGLATLGCARPCEALECPGRRRVARAAFPGTELSDTPQSERRMQPEEASPSTEESFRLIVETLPGLIAVMTADGGVEHVNRQVLDYFGRTLEELRRWGTTDAVHPADLPQVTAACSTPSKPGSRTNSSIASAERMANIAGSSRAASRFEMLMAALSAGTTC